MGIEAGQMKARADRIGAGVLVLLLVAAILKGPAWMVVTFVLVVPVVAVVWETAWARFLRGQPPSSPELPRQ
jgi:hypothetical protein